MKHAKILMLLLWFTTLISLQASTENNHIVNEEEECEEYSYPPQVCYQFSKEDFDSTLNISEDIIVGHIGNIDEVSYVNLTLTEAEDISYGSTFECNNDRSDNYKCFDSYNIGKMQVNFKDESMFVHIDYAQVSEASAPVIHHVKSKEKTFSKGVKTPCYLSVEPQLYVKDLKKGSQKEKLLQSINIQDVIIYDLDYHNDLVIAVGESNSPSMREMQTHEENYESVILRSTDGGKSWQKLEEVISVPYEKVIVFDEKKIIVVSSSIEGFGGLIQISSDGGEHWKDKDIGMIESFKYIDNEVVVTNIVGTIFRSKDGGKSWEEQVAIEEPKSSELSNNENHVPVNIVKDEGISVLKTPQYRVDYETNTLIVQHFQNDCNCNAFSLPLTYNQSNKRKGILGQYWSLGIETQITVINKDKLSLFDAVKGEEEIYIRDNTSKDLFRHGGKKIEKTKNGYFTTSCDTSKQYFNKDGYLVKLEYKEKSYSIHYRNNKISKVMEMIKGKSHPYLSFSHKYEGISVTYHHTKERKIITFLKNASGTLSSILDGNHHLFHYRYTYDNTKLDHIEYIPEMDLYKTVFKFDYPSNDKTIVYDFRKQKNGIIKEKTYLHHSKGTEHICVVNAITKHMNSDVLESIQSETDMYHFSYYEATRNKLLSTEYDSRIYGLDDMGRVNYYSRWSKEISLDYHPFGKMAYSTVKHGDRISKYSYEYTKDASHNLQKMTTPYGTIELKYDKKDQIKELIIDKYHLYYEYGKSDRPTKIIVSGKGELRITYDDNHNIESTKTVLYDKNTTEHIIALDVSEAMALLMKRVAEGSIKNYPKWIW